MLNLIFTPLCPDNFRTEPIKDTLEPDKNTSQLSVLVVSTIVWPGIQTPWTSAHCHFGPDLKHYSSIFLPTKLLYIYYLKCAPEPPILPLPHI